MRGDIHAHVSFENQQAVISGTSPASDSGTGGISSARNGLSRHIHGFLLGRPLPSLVIDSKSSFDSDSFEYSVSIEYSVFVLDNIVFIWKCVSEMYGKSRRKYYGKYLNARSEIVCWI